MVDTVYKSTPSIPLDTRKQIDTSAQSVMIREFYLAYVDEFAKIPSYEELVSDKYCSENLKKYLKQNETDYDLFLKGQDTTDGFSTSLVIDKDKAVADGYIVTYIDPSNNSPITIKLTVVDINGEYKIDSLY